MFRGQKEVEVIGKRPAREAGINEVVTFIAQSHNVTKIRKKLTAGISLWLGVFVRDKLA